MRIKRAVSAVKKRRKIMKQAKGYYGGKHRLYRIAKQQVMRSGYYAYVGRKQRKRNKQRNQQRGRAGLCHSARRTGRPGSD